MQAEIVAKRLAQPPGNDQIGLGETDQRASRRLPGRPAFHPAHRRQSISHRSVDSQSIVIEALENRYLPAAGALRCAILTPPSTVISMPSPLNGSRPLPEIEPSVK